MTTETRRILHVALVVSLLATLGRATAPPPLRAYPVSVREAVAARDALAHAIAERAPGQTPSAAEATRERAWLDLLTEIVALNQREEELEQSAAGLERRRAEAVTLLERPLRRNSPETASLGDLEAARTEVRGRILGLRSRRAELDDLRRRGLAEERVRAVARFDRESRLQAEVAEDSLRPISLEYAARWIAYLDRRNTHLPRELAVLDSEIEGATRTSEELERVRRELAVRMAGELSLDEQEAVRRYRFAQSRVASATGLAQRTVLAYEARTAEIEMLVARARSELARLSAEPSIADAIARARARFLALERRWSRNKAVGTGTAAVVRRARASVVLDFRSEWLTDAAPRWRKRRAAVIRALDAADVDLFQFPEELAEARGQGTTHALTKDSSTSDESEAEWGEAGRGRRAALTDLAEILRKVSDEYLVRLEAAQELTDTLRAEQRWIERRSLLVAEPSAHVLRSMALAIADVRSWLIGLDSRRRSEALALLALALAAGLVALRVRARLGVRAAALTERDGRRRKIAQRAWLAVLRNGVWVVVAGLLLVFVPDVMGSDPREQAALRAVFGLATGVLALYALARGLSHLAPELESAAAARWLLGNMTVLVLCLGLPYVLLEGVDYEASNPGVLRTLGLVLRTALAVRLGLAITRRARFRGLAAESERERYDAVARVLGPLMGLVLLVVVGADWLGWGAFASWLFKAFFGGVASILLGVVATASALRAIHASRGNVDARALARRALLTGLVRSVIKVTGTVAVVAGLMLSFGIRRADLSALAPVPLVQEGGLTFGRLASSLLWIVALWVVLPRLRSFLDLFVLEWLEVEKGVRYSIATVSHYLALVLAALVVVSSLGVGFGDVQWLLAAAGVGIGFGLQEIVSNFVSGIIILFERPIKVGDIVEIDGTQGEVAAVNIRSTTVVTLDNHQLFVPNKELITRQLTNFTGNDPKVRLELPIGVAYGSDIKLVRELLLEIAERHGLVWKKRAPEVIFIGHGDSSLDFILRVWADFSDRFSVKSDLRSGFDAAFRRHGIEIPFPQRDIHIRSAEGIGQVRVGPTGEDGADAEEAAARNAKDSVGEQA